ncbi:MAG: zinc ribbon domain-containing protein [Thermodesulfovibrionia bacterium]|nr:zinc ribbon domain-containing protein [Thermodesulfovibrionia bacterium]
MALIKCPECGTEVSDKAVACPKCAHPIVEGSAEQAQTVKAQPIKKTAKKYKGKMLIGIFLMVLGFLLIVSSVSGQQLNVVTGVLGVLATVGGVVWLIIAEFSSWWQR